VSAQTDLTRDRCSCGTKLEDMKVVRVGKITVRECPNCQKQWYVNHCYQGNCGHSIFMPYVQVGEDNTRCPLCEWYYCPQCHACQCNGRPAAEPHTGPVVIIEEGGSYNPNDWEQQ
jgi:hypothetical protein